MFKHFNKTDIKFILFFGFFLLLSLVFVYRLYSLQIVNGENNRDLINSLHLEEETSYSFKRGIIFFKDNKNNLIPAVTTKYSHNLILNNRHLVNAEEAYKKLSEIIPYEKDLFLQKTVFKDDPYIILDKNIDESLAKKIKNANIRGIEIEEKFNRYYHYGSLAGKTLGFLSRNDSGNFYGSHGLEKNYEEVLNRNKVDRKNIWRFIFDINNEIKNNKILEKGSVQTTIDINVQYYLEKVLEKIDKKYNTRYSAGIIMEPYTGRIVAMADSKNFDLNKVHKDYRNVLVESQFEFGSVIKPLTVAIGLDTKSINENFLYNDRGYTVVNDQRISNYDLRGRGENTSIFDILANSLNVGVIKITEQIEKDSFRKYLIDLGFSTETGIDLPHEIVGDLRSLDLDNDINFASVSFGQGIAPTPIGAIRALSTLASDGFLVEPYIVEKIDYDSEVPDIIKETKRVKIFSKKTTDYVKDILSGIVDNSLAGGLYSDKYYSVATKSGTAQVADLVRGGYIEGEYLHSFFGFFPTEADPKERYSILLFTLNPETEGYASETLASPFFEIFNYMKNYFDIKPDRALEPIF